MTDTTASLPILEAVNALFQDIRSHHPEIPNAVIVVGASGRRKKSQVHGHFAPESWTGKQHEIMLSGESLSRGPVATLGTLIHESAHALAHARGVQDTSNHGRYHNKRFKDLAESLGIDLDQAQTLGWSVTTVPDATADKYQAGLGRLTAALTTWRETPAEKDDPKPRKSTRVKIHCGCGPEGETTVSKKWWESKGDALKCDDCFEGFVAEED